MLLFSFEGLDFDEARWYAYEKRRAQFSEIERAYSSVGYSAPLIRVRSVVRLYLGPPLNGESRELKR